MKLTELEMVKMYKAYYSSTTHKVKQVEFKKRKTTVIKGAASWVELYEDSEMYKQGILVGKEVM
jgi:hypothetical protein